MKKAHLFPLVVLLVIVTISLICCKQNDVAPKQSYTFEIPPDYLREAPEIPDFWVSEYSEVNAFLDRTVKKGRIEVIGTSAGGRPIRAVFYGTPRQGKGTSTFSGSLGFGDV